MCAAKFLGFTHTVAFLNLRRPEPIDPSSATSERSIGLLGLLSVFGRRLLLFHLSLLSSMLLLELLRLLSVLLLHLLLLRIIVVFLDGLLVFFFLLLLELLMVLRLPGS